MKKKIQRLRMRLAWRLFPISSVGVSANRITKTLERYPHKWILTYANLKRPGGYCEEDMIKFMEEYVGRQLHPNEINVLQSMKYPGRRNRPSPPKPPTDFRGDPNA